MPRINDGGGYIPPKPKPAPKQELPKWVPRYEPYNPFAPKKESRNETVNKVNATREPWRPFQTVANIFEQAVNNPYNPFSRTQTMIGPQNNPWAPFAGMPVTQRRMTFAGIPTLPAYATGAQNRKAERMEFIPPFSQRVYGPNEQIVNRTTQTFPVGAWQNEQFFNIPDLSGPLYWTPQYINAPQHAPNYGGGWSSWGGGGGGGGGDRSSAAFYQGNYTQQRARWNETLLTWGLRQE